MNIKQLRQAEKIFNKLREELCYCWGYRDELEPKYHDESCKYRKFIEEVERDE